MVAGLPGTAVVCWLTGRGTPLAAGMEDAGTPSAGASGLCCAFFPGEALAPGPAAGSAFSELQTGRGSSVSVSSLTPFCRVT